MSAGSAPAPDFAALRTRAALAGVTVHRMRSSERTPEYVACRWSSTRTFQKLEDLQRWLDQIGAPR